MAKATAGSDFRLWVIFVAVALITIASRAEIALLFVLAGLVGILLYAFPRGGKENVSLLALALPSAAGGGAAPLLLKLGTFFVKAGAFTFGSGLAIVPFLHQGVVSEARWLTERQFLDAVAVGVITPGPVVITAAFVGYLVAGFWGAVVALGGVFLPVYLFVLFIGGFIIRYRENPVLKGFVKGATAAASGAIAGATVILTQGSIVDIPTAAIAAVSLLLLWRWKLPEPLLVAGAALLGIVLFRAP